MTPPYYLTEAEKTIFFPAVIQVLNDNTLRIGKGVLGFIERNPVLFPVLYILEVIRVFPVRLREKFVADRYDRLST